MLILLRLIAIIALTVGLLSFSFISPSQEEDIVTQEKPEKLHDFSAFINKFYYNNSFQMERVVFPCPQINYFTKDDVPSKEFFTKKTWDLYDRNNEKEVEIVIILKSHKKIVVKYFICDTCFNQEHIFELINGKWYLTWIDSYVI